MQVYLNPGDDPLQSMVNKIYSHLEEEHVNMEYIRDRAILTPLNEYVEAVNNEVLHRLPESWKFIEAMIVFVRPLQRQLRKFYTLQNISTL